MLQILVGHSRPVTTGTVQFPQMNGAVVCGI
jgi:hypothetical protein